MAKKKKIDLPIAPLPDLVRWWQSQDTRGVLIGGLAVSLLGRPRVTRDIDGLVMLEPERWAEFLDAAAGFGFLPRLPGTLEFAHEARVLLLRHQPSAIDVDVSLGNLPFEEEAVSRGVRVDVAGISAPLATVEDLIIMKAVAHRDQDWLDIDGLLAVHPNLDRRRVRRWVRKFADALESPELCNGLEDRLARHSPKKHRKGKRNP